MLELVSHRKHGSTSEVHVLKMSILYFFILNSISSAESLSVLQSFKFLLVVCHSVCYDVSVFRLTVKYDISNALMKHLLNPEAAIIRQ